MHASSASSSEPSSAAAKGRGAGGAAERVRVFCRLRPLLQREKNGWSYEEFAQQFGDDPGGGGGDAQEQRPESPSDDEQQQATFVTDKGRLNFSASASSTVSLAADGRTILFQPPGSEKEFVFDASLDESVGQAQVYAQVAREIVRDVLEGYNGTVFAYGQTSTGKTHTMVGRDGHDLLSSEQRGVIPRALEEIFQSAEQAKARITTTVALSYVQIYCERVFDLLDPEIPHASILIREDPERGVYLDGASCTSVSGVGECLELLARGNANRAVAATGMNAHSSRSHAILILRVERKELVALPDAAAPRQTIKISNLYLVDLAGSERVKKAKVVGRHVSELKAINLSLSALGNCISALSKKHKHVPYRDSKLTRLLQSSLGGNAKTALVVTITPAPAEAHETLSTLQFGQRAMQVLVSAHCNVLSVLDYKALYEDAQQRLDAAGERARELESAALEHKLRVAQLDDQLLKAHVRIQHLEFENQAGKAALEAASSRGGDPSSTSGPSACAADPPSGLAQHLAELVAQHGADVNKVKDRCELQVATYKKLADEASLEWHEVEDALASEKLQVLSSLQELKEFKLRYFELEEETTERIAELVQEVREKEREAAESAKTQVDALAADLRALKQQLADAEREHKCLQHKMEADFVPRDTIEQMEALYEKAIAKLQQRVGSLESKSTAAPTAAAAAAPGAFQRKVVVSPPPASNQVPERANIGGPQSSKAGAKAGGSARAVPKIGRLVPGSKAPSGLW